MTQNNNNQNPDDCSVIKNAFSYILEQTKVSYDGHLANLNNYTQIVFNDDHQNLHKTWKKTNYLWLFPDGTPLPVEYDEEIPKDAIKHLLEADHATRKQLIAKEMINLSKRLQLLHSVIKTIYEELSDQTISNPNDARSNIHVHNFFSQQYDYIRAVIREVASGMNMLGIKDEIVNGPKIPQGNLDLRDWIVTREHLKLLNYMLKVSETFMQNC